MLWATVPQLMVISRMEVVYQCIKPPVSFLHERVLYKVKCDVVVYSTSTDGY
jgi:hypothetical protein